MSINFNRIWASDTNPDYPTDSQTKRGLSYLGTEAPTFDLHDAIFQDGDRKSKWLYDQVRIACEKFGQKVQDDDGSLVSDARDTMANAITYALLNQRKSDEGGHGIVRMANYEQVQDGAEYNLAVSPVHLKEYMENHNTWANTKDKPQTATRWPTWAEVAEKPSWGTAAWKSVSDFDPAGKAESLFAALDSAISRIGKSGVISDSSGSLEWGRVSSKPSVLNNIYNGNGDTVITSSSGAGKLTVSDEWINFYPKGKGSSFSAGPDGRIYNAFINHDQVLGLGSAALASSSDYEPFGAVKTAIDSLSNISKDGKWTSIIDPPGWTHNIYSGNGDTVITSPSGGGRLSISDEWLNFYPSKTGACISVGPDGRIYNSNINHDQVLGLGSAALTPATDYEKSGEVNGLRNSLSEIAFTGAWASLNNVPQWVPRIYAGSSNSATGILSSSGKTRLEVTDEWLNFFPVSGQSSKLTLGPDGILRNCTLPLASIIGYDSLATKLGTGQLVVTKENNGYIRFENGTILQFATGDFGVNETAMWVNFPTPFPNACLWAGVSTRLLGDNNDTNTWFQLVSWDSYTAKVFRQIVDSGTNKQQTAPYIFAIGS